MTDKQYIEADTKAQVLAYYNYFSSLFEGQLFVGSLITGIVRTREAMLSRVDSWVGRGRLQWISHWLKQSEAKRKEQLQITSLVALTSEVLKTAAVSLTELVEVIQGGSSDVQYIKQWF